MRTVTVSHNWYSSPWCSGTAVPTVFGVLSNVLCQDRGRTCQAWLGLVRMKSELGHSLTPIVLCACSYQGSPGGGCCLDIEVLVFGSVQHPKASGSMDVRRTEWSNMIH